MENCESVASSRVVYMSSKILKLALAVESSDLSQAEKKKLKQTNLKRI